MEELNSIKNQSIVADKYWMMGIDQLRVYGHEDEDVKLERG